jgi:pimeloyl-ACP methyl ester carboxylesterase
MNRFLRVLGRIAVALIVVAVLAVTAMLAWSSMVLRGERPASIDAWTNPEISITTTDSSIVITPIGVPSGDGLVFIPGAKVDPYAYMFKLSGIVEETGMTVVITKPTLNLAFFDQRPLSTFTDAAPDVSRWFVGGHSLGGVKACMLADDPDVAGLVLFASYCANDLSQTSLDVLSIAGSADLLSTAEKIDAAASLLPESTQFVEIEGLNHAGFGDYGVQPGDGSVSLTSDQARDEITRVLKEFLANLAP